MLHCDAEVNDLQLSCSLHSMLRYEQHLPPSSTSDPLLCVLPGVERPGSRWQQLAEDRPVQLPNGHRGEQ